MSRAITGMCLCVLPALSNYLSISSVHRSLFGAGDFNCYSTYYYRCPLSLKKLFSFYFLLLFWLLCPRHQLQNEWPFLRCPRLVRERFIYWNNYIRQKSNCWNFDRIHCFHQIYIQKQKRIHFIFTYHLNSSFTYICSPCFNERSYSQWFKECVSSSYNTKIKHRTVMKNLIIISEK